MNFDGILEGIKGLFQPKQPQEIISPLPPGQTMTAGLAHKMKFDQMMEKQAAANREAQMGQPTPTPQTVQYPESFANAPSDKQRNAISLIRENRPDYKGSDSDIVALYNKHGEGLLSEIYKNLEKAVQPQESVSHDVLGATTQTPANDLWGKFMETTRREAQERGYDPETVIRQKALESDFGRSNFAKERNNFGGIGAYDSDPNKAFSFDDIEDYLDYYFNLVEKRYPQAYKNRQNPQKYAEGLKAGGYASDPDYVWKIMNTPLNPR